MKRKAIIAARNKRSPKKARVDEQETFLVSTRVSDLGIFEALPVEIQQYILADILCGSASLKEDIIAIVSAKLTCTRWKQLVDSACIEDFYWGVLYLKIFGDISKRKGISAKDKFLKTHHEFVVKFISRYRADLYRINTLHEARAFDPTRHFQEIDDDCFDTAEPDWNYITYESIASNCRWMTQPGLDVLLYTYLQHLFDQGTSSYGKNIVLSICGEMPQTVKEFLLAFEKKEPDAMPELAMECLQDCRRVG